MLPLVAVFSVQLFSKMLKNQRSRFSHFWFATVQETLQADWQDAWHSPQPPLTQLSFRLA